MGTRKASPRARLIQKTAYSSYAFRRRITASDAGDGLEEGDIAVLDRTAPIGNGQLCGVMAWHSRMADGLPAPPSSPVKDEEKFWVYRRRFSLGETRMHYQGEARGMIGGMLEFDNGSAIAVVAIETDEFSNPSAKRPIEAVARLRAAHRMQDFYVHWNPKGTGYYERLKAIGAIIVQLTLADETANYFHPVAGKTVWSVKPGKR